MIKKEEKQFAFVGCRIVCIFVACCLLMLAFCDVVVADIDISVDGTTTNYDFYKANATILSFTQSSPTFGSYYHCDVLSFSNIDFYDSLDFIQYEANQPMQIDAGAPLGATVNFVADIEGDVVGEGVISYTYNSVTSRYAVRYYFDWWDISGYSGDTDVALDYDRANFYNLTSRYYYGVRVDPWAVSIQGALSAGEGFSGTYSIRYSALWHNRISIDVLGDAYYNCTVTKFNESSTIIINTSASTYISETAPSIDDFNFLVFEAPIYFYVWDIWDNLYTESFVGIPAENALFGYVFDAADNFGIEGAFVVFQDQNTTTSGTGFYFFNSDTFGDSWLNVSKSGYQNFNKTIDYTGDQRYDIFLTKNETVNPGTCTVAGIVTDATSGEPILNALVWIKNTTFSSYRYTNANGYYVFYDLHNTTYTVSAEQDGYHKQQLDINLTDIDTAYYYDFALLAITDEEVPPTPTPKPPETLPEHVDNIFDLLGIEDWSVILASAVIMFMGGIFGGWSHFNPIVIMFGGFFGFLICIYMGLLPSWMLALVIVITVLLIVGVVARKYVGDE